MSSGQHAQGHREVSVAEGRIELGRLLDDVRFHGTERARNILKYLAERHFQGCDEAVKAYSIALDVLGRGADFDASSDPIVRIEMSRLRSSLSQYYEAFGEQQGVSINLPVGRYVAVFSRNITREETENAEPNTSPVLVENDEPGTGEAIAPARVARRFSRLHVAGLALLGLVASGSAAAAWYGSRPVMTIRPFVTLSISSPQAYKVAEAEATGDYLVTALSKFRTLSISSQKSMSTGSTARSAEGVARNSYDIEMKYYADGDDRSVWWRVVDEYQGTVLKSGVEKVEADGRSDATVRDELVSTLAKRFGSPRGVISILESQNGAMTNTLGNTCVLEAEYALDEGGRNGIRNAIPCLERTVALQSGNADALAVLSRMIVAAEGGDPATTPFDRALTLANRAASIDPTSDRAQVAIMMAQFYAGRTEAAIAAGNQAQALNPDNPDVLSKFAAVLYSSGYSEAGVALARDAARGIDAVPRDARIVIALDAYERGDYSGASLAAEQINCGDIVVKAIRAASLGQMSSPASAASLANLSDILPDYRTSLTQKMEWRRYPTSVIESVQQGLAKARLMKEGEAVAAQAVN